MRRVGCTITGRGTTRRGWKMDEFDPAGDVDGPNGYVYIHFKACPIDQSEQLYGWVVFGITS